MRGNSSIWKFFTHKFLLIISSPLISQWLTSEEGDDDVFESPESNLRFMLSLSPACKERVNAIQQFGEQN